MRHATTLRRGGLAALLGVAVAAHADTTLREENRGYYGAWHHLSTSSIAERARAALATGIHDAELQKTKDAMELVDSLELPL